MATASVASCVYVALPRVYNAFRQPDAARRRRRAELCRAAVRTAAAGGTVPTLSTTLATGAVDMLVDPQSTALVMREDARPTPMAWRPDAVLVGGAVREARRVQARTELERVVAGGVGVVRTHPCRFVTRAEQPMTVGGVGPVQHDPPVKNFAVWRAHKASVAMREKCVTRRCRVAYEHQIAAAPRPFLREQRLEEEEGPSAELGRWTKVKCLSTSDLWERHPIEQPAASQQENTRSVRSTNSRATYMVTTQ